MMRFAEMLVFRHEHVSVSLSLLGKLGVYVVEHIPQAHVLEPPLACD